MTDDSGPGRSHPSTADKPFHLNFLWRAGKVERLVAEDRTIRFAPAVG